LITIFLIAAGLLAPALAVAASTPTFLVGDLPRIVAPKPPLPPRAGYIDDTANWGGPVFPVNSSTFRKSVLRAFKTAGFIQARDRAWKTNFFQSGDVINANATAFLFRRASGARTAFAALRSIAKRSAKPSQYSVAQTIGEESFRIEQFGAVEYFWQTSNLVIHTYMHCVVSCHVVHAARAYADAIQART
jgi:hypothetical protein